MIIDTKIKWCWGTFFSLAGLVLAVGSSIACLFIEADSRIIISLIFLWLLLICTISSMIFREVVYARKSRYAEASDVIHDFFHLFREIQHYIFKGDACAAENAFRHAMLHIEKLFSLVTSTSCRACIKIIRVTTDDKKEFKTKTFVRSAKPSPEADEEKWADITKNTDFSSILLQNPQKLEYNTWFSNNLTKVNPYLNSSWPEAHEQRKKYIKNKDFSYISTIVWPIRAYDEKGTIGFLCIDSKARNVFSRRYDLFLGASFADALFLLLYEYREKFLVLKKEENNVS